VVGNLDRGLSAWSPTKANDEQQDSQLSQQRQSALQVVFRLPALLDSFEEFLGDAGPSARRSRLWKDRFCRCLGRGCLYLEAVSNESCNSR